MSHHFIRSFKRSFLCTAALLGVLFFLVSSGYAQEDDGGVLPGANSTNPSGGGGSGSSTQSAAYIVHLYNHGEGWVPIPLDPGAARLWIAGEMSEFVELKIDEVSVEEATVSAMTHYPILASQPSSSEVVMQGDARIELHQLLKTRLLAAPLAAGRTTLLLLHEYIPGQSMDRLQDVVSGEVVPAQFLFLGDIPSLDLGVFSEVVSRHGSPSSVLAATWVFLSVDASGALHISAVRASSDVQTLEMVTGKSLSL